jgi:hypothetical protein
MFRDIEALACAFFRDELAVPTASEVPRDRPATFLRVWRTGGAAVNRRLDAPILTVQAWAPTKVAAAELGNRARSYLYDAGGRLLPVSRLEETTGAYYDPDPATESPRVTFSATLYVPTKI